MAPINFQDFTKSPIPAELTNKSPVTIPEDPKDIIIPVESMTPHIVDIPNIPHHRHHDSHPKGNDKTPKGNDKSPKGNDKSPKGNDKSPKGNDKSPKGKSRHGKHRHHSHYNKPSWKPIWKPVQPRAWVAVWPVGAVDAADGVSAEGQKSMDIGKTVIAMIILLIVGITILSCLAATIMRLCRCCCCCGTTRRGQELEVRPVTSTADRANPAPQLNSGTAPHSAAEVQAQGRGFAVLVGIRKWWKLLATAVQMPKKEPTIERIHMFDMLTISKRTAEPN